MVELARTKAEEAGVADRIDLVTGTIDAVPDEAAFDGATMMLVEHIHPDDGTKLGLLKQVARRLKAGGWFVLAGLHGETEETNDALDAWIQLVGLRGMPEQAQDAIRHKATVEDNLVPEARIRALLAEAGFGAVQRIYHAQLLGAWLAQRA